MLHGRRCGHVRSQCRDALGGVDILIAPTRAVHPAAASATSLTLSSTSTRSRSTRVDDTMCIEAVPQIREQGWGRVVAITSIGARQAMPHLILSATACCGRHWVSEDSGARRRGRWHTVNSLQPGLHATDRLRQLYGGDVVGRRRGTHRRIGAARGLRPGGHLPVSDARRSSPAPPSSSTVAPTSASSE